MMLNLGDSQCSSLHFKEQQDSEQAEVETIGLVEFCNTNHIGRIDLLKMDIEGAELQVLPSLKDDWIVNNVVQLTIEFHEFLDPSIVPDIKEIIKKLKGLGFYYLPFSHSYGDVLFVNSRFIKLSPIDLSYLFMVKYARGISRILRRKL
jgi:hypothetical protein